MERKNIFQYVVLFQYKKILFKFYCRKKFCLLLQKKLIKKKSIVTFQVEANLQIFFLLCEKHKWNNSAKLRAQTVVLYMHTHMYVYVYRSVARSCPMFWHPVDCIMPGSSVHGISQARILEWVAISFCWDLPDPGVKPLCHALGGGFFAIEPPGKPECVIAYIQMKTHR